jgi:hypothetical protein
MKLRLRTESYSKVETYEDGTPVSQPWHEFEFSIQGKRSAISEVRVVLPDPLDFDPTKPVNMEIRNRRFYPKGVKKPRRRPENNE